MRPPRHEDWSTNFGKHMSRWSASQVGVGTATSFTSLANSSAIDALHVAGMRRTVGTCAANTSSNVGTSDGLGSVMAVLGLGGVRAGGGNIGTGTCGGSGATFGPPGAARQFLHLAVSGTSVRHGSPHNLTPRLCRTPGGIRSPCTVCFAAMCATRARRDRWMNASGQVCMGHDVGHAPRAIVGCVASGRAAWRAARAGVDCVASSSSASSSLGARLSHPMRTATLGSCTTRVVRNSSIIRN